MGKPILLFYCSRLGGGGAEKHLQRILNAGDRNEYAFHLALNREGGSYEKELRNDVVVHHLTNGQRSSTGALLRALIPLWRLIENLKPVAVISFMDRQNVALASLRTVIPTSVKFVFCVQNAPAKSLGNSGWNGRFFLKLLPWAYQRADRIMAICQGVGEELKEAFSISTPISVVYNAGYDPDIFELVSKPLPAGVIKKNNQLIACGRLTKQKGFDLLLEALAMIKQEDWHLWLLGRGEDEDALKEQAQRLELTDKVAFLGFQDNPYAFYGKADLFVLSSRWEGFGNVITEAMASNCPVIATRCDFGPDEIIDHGKTGYLVEPENITELGQQIKWLLQHNDELEELRMAGKVRASDFTAENIAREYLSVISKAIRAKSLN